jgi:purine-binding chemotaxis protein CheW
MEGVLIMQASLPEATREYLAFSLGGEHYGIDITQVREIRALEPVTRLVEAPAYVRGVMNLRGSMVLVTDLRARFGMPPAEPGAKAVMIVIDARDMVGMVVDGVTDVVALRAGEIQSPATLQGAVDERFVEGIANHEDRMLIVLDVVPLLTLAAPGDRAQ